MGMEVNGAVILAAIASSPSDFALSNGQVNALALSTLLARLKDKAVALGQVRAIAKAVGKHDFGLALDHLPSKDIAALTKRLDPNHPDLRTSDLNWQRGRIIELSDYSAEPEVAQPKPPRTSRAATPKPTSPKTGEIMKAKALKPRAKRSVAKD